MKIILTTQSADLDSNIDPRFGRCAYFIVYDTDTTEWQAHPNPAMRASGGAGIHATQFISDQGASAVVSGKFGPNAVYALNNAGVKMYTYGQINIAHAAIQGYLEGKLAALPDDNDTKCR